MDTTGLSRKELVLSLLTRGRTTKFIDPMPWGYDRTFAIVDTLFQKEFFPEDWRPRVAKRGFVSAYTQCTCQWHDHREGYTHSIPVGIDELAAFAIHDPATILAVETEVFRDYLRAFGGYAFPYPVWHFDDLRAPEYDSMTRVPGHPEFVIERYENGRTHIFCPLLVG